jgi:hypothetical protein
MRSIAGMTLFALAMFAASGARAATPLDDLIEPAAGRGACFTRVYDDGHLRRNPKQKTTAITVWLSYEQMGGSPPGIGLGLGLAISRRGDPKPLFAQGGCNWDERANRNTSDQRLIKQFKKDAGAVCIMSAEPDVFEATSAQEGGHLIFDRGQDRDTLLLYLDDRLTMVTRANRSKQLDIRFGADDRVFLLRRSDMNMNTCAAVENAVTEPEPGVPPRRR